MRAHPSSTSASRIGGAADSAIPSETFVTVAMWVLTGYFALGVIMNGISRSKPGHNLMTPVCAVLAGRCLVVAIG